jgi:hypothetical protein
VVKNMSIENAIRKFEEMEKSTKEKLDPTNTNNDLKNVISRYKLNTRIKISVANEIQPNSWLNEEKYDWFKKGYQYALTQNRSIAAMSSASPEDLYFFVSSILRANDIDIDEIQTTSQIIKKAAEDTEKTNAKIEKIREQTNKVFDPVGWICGKLFSGEKVIT